MKEPGLVRISFQLPQSLSDQFSRLAAKKGIPQSKLLREWLNASTKLTLAFANLPLKQKPVTYHFRATKIEALKLNGRAQALGLNRSGYLRQLINSELSQPDNSVAKNQNLETVLKKLHQQGKSAELITSLHLDPEQHSDYELLLIADGLIETGYMDKAHQLIDILINRSKGYFLLAAKVIQIDLALNSRDFDLCTHLMQELDNQKLELATYRNLVARSLVQKGQLCSYLEQFDQALEYLNDAIDIADSVNYPIVLIKAYLRLNRVLESLGRFAEAGHSLSRAHKLNSVLGNVLMAANLNMDLGFFSLVKGQPELAARHLQQSNDQYSKEGYKYHLIYNDDNTGRVHLFNGDYATAYKYLQKSYLTEMKLRPHAEFSHSRMLMTLIEAKDDFAGSMKSLSIPRQGPVYFRSAREYTFATAQYLFGTNADIRLQGEKNLLKLGRDTDNQVVKHTVELTLSQRRIGPVQ